uniref:Uncharacterized protein n=1 Tax=Glossina brevipalpis TaxID=37001 RepID=A0A1A9W9M8_9MUSC
MCRKRKLVKQGELILRNPCKRMRYEYDKKRIQQHRSIFTHTMSCLAFLVRVLNNPYFLMFSVRLVVVIRSELWDPHTKVLKEVPFAFLTDRSHWPMLPKHQNDNAKHEVAVQKRQMAPLRLWLLEDRSRNQQITCLIHHFLLWSERIIHAVTFSAITARIAALNDHFSLKLYLGIEKASIAENIVSSSSKPTRFISLMAFSKADRST